MVHDALNARVKGNDLARWAAVVLLAFVLFWGIWHFLKRSEKPAKNNPSQTAALTRPSVGSKLTSQNGAAR